MDFAALTLSIEVTRHAAGSALPNAPVVPDRVRTPRAAGLRIRVATELRSVARWVEPAPRRTYQPN